MRKEFILIRVLDFNRIHLLLCLLNWVHFFSLPMSSFPIILNITMRTRKHVEAWGKVDGSACGDAHFDKSLRSSSLRCRDPFLISWRGCTSNSPECFRPDVSLGLSLPPSTSDSFLLSHLSLCVMLFWISLYRIYQRFTEYTDISMTSSLLYSLLPLKKISVFYLHVHAYIRAFIFTSSNKLKEIFYSRTNFYILQEKYFVITKEGKYWIILFQYDNLMVNYFIKNFVLVMLKFKLAKQTWPKKSLSSPHFHFP